MPTTTERRRDPRLCRTERLFVQVAGCSETPDRARATLRAATADISASGLRILVNEEVPVGCSLELWVKVESRPGTFLLKGEVRWIRPAEASGAYVVGVALDPGNTRDSKRWQELLALALPEEGRGTAGA